MIWLVYCNEFFRYIRMVRCVWVRSCWFRYVNLGKIRVFNCGELDEALKSIYNFDKSISSNGRKITGWGQITSEQCKVKALGMVRLV